MRLIDADALIEKLVISHTAHSQNTREASLLNRDVRMVMDMPTAFDVEKVVAELEEAKKKNFESWDKATDIWDVLIYGNVVNAYGNAISIVKKGGV